jgi:hypothetical protein
VAGQKPIFGFLRITRDSLSSRITPHTKMRIRPPDQGVWPYGFSGKDAGGEMARVTGLEPATSGVLMQPVEISL